MQVVRMKVAPDTVAYADAEHHRLIVEFAIPGAPTETIDVKNPRRQRPFISASKGHRLRFGTGFRLAGET